MLSRTADNLYWLARYVERAEYLARILDTTLRVNTLPLSYGGVTNEWELAVASAGCVNAFFAAYGEANEDTVTDFLAFSTKNPSSIRNCFEIARLNARAVRTALTTEMWDTINSIWLELKNWSKGPSSREEFARFLRWVMGSSLRYDGSAYRTMLRNDAYCFSRLGVYLERADNTARILDVKYHLLLPPVAKVGGPLGLDASHYRDDILRLLFVCCHPELPASQQIAVALRIVSGLTVKEIARAFLVSESAMEQRITRAKARITAAEVPFDTPGAPERAERLAAVATMIYLIFNEGYSASGGNAHVRGSLCEEAPSARPAAPRPACSR